MDVNDIIKRNNKIIKYLAYKHCGKYDYDDFLQELYIQIWLLFDKYDKTKLDNEDIYLKIWINTLIKRVYKKMSSIGNKDKKCDEAYIDNNNCAPSVDLDSIIESKLTSYEQFIVHTIDYYSCDKKFSYTKIAKKIGIPPRMMYYYLNIIRNKIKNGLKDVKT